MRELSRSRLLLPAALVSGIAVLALGWYGLGGSADSPGSSRYVEGIVGEPLRPSPLFARGHAPDEDLAALIFSGLVRIAGDGTPLPDLAEAWEVAPDARTYSFRLRDDIYWHDGRRVTSSDVAFTVARVQQPGFQGPATLALRWTGVELQTPDAHTVIFRLTEARAGFLAQTALGVVPAHLLAGLGIRDLLEAPFHQAPIGSGPFRLVELSAQRALLERNPSYHLGAPAIDEIELRFYTSAAALEAALAAGELDGALLAEGRDRQAAALLAARPALRTLDMPRNGFTLLYLNNGRPPLDDARTRRAIVAAIDRAALLLAAAPGAAAGEAPIVPGSWAYAEVEAPGPDEAAALFAAAGWLRGDDGVLASVGRPLALTLVTNAEPEREALAALVAEQLGAHGASVTVEAAPASELVRRLGLRDYELAIFGWEAAVDPDPYGAWHTSQIAPPGRNLAAYHDSEADALLEAARQTLDEAERRALYAAFTKRFVDQAPSAVLLYPVRTYLLPATLEGVEPGLLFRPSSRFRNIHSWIFFEGTAASASGPAVPQVSIESSASR
jgi:peptide/nickel transport system substrate-binding protein